MKIVRVTDAKKFASKIILQQPPKDKTVVESILMDVMKNGDQAIRKYEKKFGGTDLRSLSVSKQEIKNAYSKVTKTEIDALRLAKNYLEKSELSVRSLLKNKTIQNDGTKISKKFVPLESVGCYIPGGLARYPSSVVMSVVPAKVAGVKRIVAVSPPRNDGTLDPLTIIAAKICGVDELYKVGGAQAIAALSYGTRTITKVDKIVGPGGKFVTIAKSLVSQHTGIDMLAGPTELGILADASSNPRFVALDLFSQAEHSDDTFCYVITNSAQTAKAVQSHVSELLSHIQRSSFVKTSLENNGFIAICKTRSEMIKLANILAPEHLQIVTKNPESFASKVHTPGLILLGDYSPSAASDYLFGSNHILPTNGFGKIRGSLSVLDFIKISTWVSSSKPSLAKISKHLHVLTEAEGLPNHHEAVRSRLK